MSIISVNINENNYDRKYTSETEISSLKITAPVLNLLPYKNYKNYCAPVALSGTYKDLHGFYHFDFTNGLSSSSGRRLLKISNIYNLTDLKPGTYTICIKIENIHGTYSLGNMNCYRNYKVIGSDTNSSQNIGTIGVNIGKDVLYSLVFSIGDNQMTISFDIGCDFLTWNTAIRDLSFDMVFLGLFEGEFSVDRSNDNFGESPQIIIENSKNIVGEYEISTNIQRHLSQIERHITAQDDNFKICFR